MQVYLIRHGETGGNVAKRHQAEHSPLTKAGIEQAREVSKTLKKHNITNLISSPLVRAIETARVISEDTGLDIQIEYSFVELKRPKYLYGRFHFSASSLFYYTLWFFGREDEEKLGESYKTVRARIDEAKNFLSSFPSDARIVVVTHSVFMSLFVFHLCRNKPQNIFQALFVFLKIAKMPNGHMIPIAYEPKDADTCPWQNNYT